MTLRFLAPQSRAVPAAFTALLALTLFFNGQALAHNVDTSDAAFLQAQSGVAFWPYFYLGAKHMVTGLDHLLFLAGVVFFLRSFRGDFRRLLFCVKSPPTLAWVMTFGKLPP
jgi:hydrogenase/urease accessory protein HupE